MMEMPLENRLSTKAVIDRPQSWLHQMSNASPYLEEIFKRFLEQKYNKLFKVTGLDGQLKEIRY